ncbi:hypothetical protein V3I01_02445 [Sphingomonas sp. gentR]|nr:hypothetical protein [Sphingomonas sp. LK11]
MLRPEAGWRAYNGRGAAAQWSWAAYGHGLMDGIAKDDGAVIRNT